MPITRNYTKKNGILIFELEKYKDSTYDSHHLESLYKAENKHFWFSMRRNKICQIFSYYVDKSSNILEIGSGTGYVAEKLIEKGFSVAISDIHLKGLQFAQKRGIQRIYQFDLFSPPFQEEFDVVCLFDVLEHFEEEKKALTYIKRILKPNGQLIFTVPAHEWLWSRDDCIAGHKRRYTKTACEKLLMMNGLELVHIEYFFSAIIPFLYLRRIIRRDRRKYISEDNPIDLSIHPFFNQMFKYMTKAEFFLQKYFSNRFGGSLLVVARNKDFNEKSVAKI